MSMAVKHICLTLGHNSKVEEHKSTAEVQTLQLLPFADFRCYYRSWNRMALPKMKKENLWTLRNWDYHCCRNRLEWTFRRQRSAATVLLNLLDCSARVYRWSLNDRNRWGQKRILPSPPHCCSWVRLRFLDSLMATIANFELHSGQWSSAQMHVWMPKTRPLLLSHWNLCLHHRKWPIADPLGYSERPFVSTLWQRLWICLHWWILYGCNPWC